ncbi:DUF3152 domain-containing protein [Streptomyces sp. NPDC001212]
MAAWSPPDAKRSPAAAGSGPRAEPTRPARPTSESPGPTPAQSGGLSIPLTGPETFVTAPGTSVKAGQGKVLRCRVEVENGIALSATGTAKEVERVLSDPRGWTADGHSAFQPVSSGATDFVIRIAAPGTVDDICGQYGLDTGGKVNCSVDRNLMVNLRRWEQATSVYAKDVTAYRTLVINHEVGHFLCHGHVTCPARGKRPRDDAANQGHARLRPQRLAVRHRREPDHRPRRPVSATVSHAPPARAQDRSPAQGECCSLRRGPHPRRHAHRRRRIRGPPVDAIARPVGPTVADLPFRI